LSCGLCCDGTLFAHAPLGEDESTLALDRGLALLSDASSLHFVLPCPRHSDDGRCEVFATGRPRVCGSFECRLLGRLKVGTVTLEQALEIVRSVKGLRAALLRAIPGESPRLYGRLWEMKKPDGALERMEVSPRAVVAAVVLSSYLKSVFESESGETAIRVTAQDLENAATELLTELENGPGDEAR